MAKTSPPTEVIQHAAGVEHLVVQAAALEVVAGPDKGTRVPFREGRVTVGTDPECDLTLSDGAVSRRQLEIAATEAGFLLRDLGSTNGTFVGDLRVREAWLYPGAEVQVGRTRLRFKPGKERESVPLSPHERFGALLGRSPAMRRCFALLERAAQSDATVLLEGAFTGADRARPGAFERAHGGTLFLDEIGEVPPELQPKLLRFLEKHEVRRVGSAETRPVDVRVVAATNRRLDDLVQKGGFRQDLFYRLAVIRVELPPLRRRREDVGLLALELARRLRADVDSATWLDERALEVLRSHDWPGNVRELRNVIERLAALPELGAGAVLGPAADGGRLPADEALARLPYHEAKERLLDAFERRYVQALLDQEGGVVARAADRAGVPRQTFFRLIKKHGLQARE